MNLGILAQTPEEKSCRVVLSDSDRGTLVLRLPTPPSPPISEVPPKKCMHAGPQTHIQCAEAPATPTGSPAIISALTLKCPLTALPPEPWGSR